MSDSTHFIQAAYARVVEAGWDVDSNNCWISHLRIGSQGYPLVNTLGGRESRRTFSAHRVMFLVASGASQVPRVVRHTCDVRACINPAHLIAGEQADNMADMAARDRSSFGERQHLHKLTAESASEIRRRYDAAGGRRGIVAELGREFGVSRAAVSLLVRGKTWIRAT